MRRLVILLIIIISMINIPACSYYQTGIFDSGSESGVISNLKDDIIDNGPVKGGSLKLFSTKPDTLNPILTNNSNVQSFSSLIYESLVKIDRDQKPQGILSDSWTVSPDGLIWTFHIRDNVYWHDKMLLTSEDVEFTVKTILSSSVESTYKRNLQNITTFAALGRSTFRLILKKPYSFTAELMTFPIIPKHTFEGEVITNSPRNMKPVGTGPYRFISYDGEKEIKLTPNENWWYAKDKNENGKSIPLISEIKIKIYPSQKDEINMFQTRETDIASIGSNSCSKYSGRSDLTLKKYLSKNYEFICFNLSKPLTGDKLVRKAIATAIDKTALINEKLPGEAVAADIPVIPGTWLYDTNILSYTPDPLKAKEMLIGDGWEDKNGTLYKKINGAAKPLTLELLINEDSIFRANMADMISRQLAEAGINLKIKRMKWEDEKKLIDTKKFDMALVGCTITSVPDISFLYSTAEAAGGYNISGYSNPLVDNYLGQILAENDQSRKKALFFNMKSLIDDDVPYIGLFFYNNAVIYNKKIRGVLNPYVWDKLNDAARWYIPYR